VRYEGQGKVPGEKEKRERGTWPLRRKKNTTGLNRRKEKRTMRWLKEFSRKEMSALDKSKGRLPNYKTSQNKRSTDNALKKSLDCRGRDGSQTCPGKKKLRFYKKSIE